MKQTLQIGLIFILAFMLQACGGGIDRVKVSKAINANDMARFKAEVTRIQTDPGYSPKSRANGLYDAFLIAAGKNKEATAYLLDQGVPIDYPADQPTSTKRGLVLTKAVENYQPEIVSLLLEHGANPNIELWSIDPRNNILYISFMHSDLVISRLLLEGGANPNQWSNPFYPSLLGHYDGHPKIQRLLEEYGGVRNPTPEQRTGLNKGQSDKKAAAIPKPSNNDAMNQTVKERLQTIHELKEQGVISLEEYSEARNKILGDL
ncbi:MAG: hypothetical protein K8R55_01035 [Desulfuromonadaceae bacterium]|nr:hypothetical protein [Desulfuromonadaceae bacterium]